LTVRLITVYIIGLGLVTGPKMVAAARNFSRLSAKKYALYDHLL